MTEHSTRRDSPGGVLSRFRFDLLLGASARTRGEASGSLLGGEGSAQRGPPGEDGDADQGQRGQALDGGTALDPTVVAKLLGRPKRADPVATLTERERSVLELMAEGFSNGAIAGRLFLSEGSISKYTTTIFAKLGLADDDDTNRRVRAVLTYLGADGPGD